ncbi:MAG: hypothetical protein NWQ54_12415 [Paraglaciecola sp.]|uniref:hypothetical protein n=1 Tax=Pseudomonadati TaxID=3379134 RepID=UPI00273FE6B1|nr:hypothetical protein [Paraglaciecola sp.]MDP5033104.1 hypothetical protein [Paraglaciecola sp.]MDP5131684.1 hypothetical protein [Paraglaciecola sp.]
MGKVSRKLIVLVLIVCVVIIAFFLYQKSQQPDLMFDDDFVIEMFEKNKKLTTELQEASTGTLAQQQSVNDLKEELSAALMEKNLQVENLNICENQKNAIVASLNESQDKFEKDVASAKQISQQCSQNMKKLPILMADVDAYKKQLEISRAENNKLVAELEALSSKEQELNSSYRVLQKKMDLIYSESVQMREDLFKPMYLKEVFVTPKFCNQVMSADEVCLDSVLVLPKFSKIPYTKVVIKLLDPSDNVIGNTVYNQQENKITQFEMQRRKEFAAGEFTIVVEADNQALRSSHFIGEKP